MKPLNARELTEDTDNTARLCICRAFPFVSVRSVAAR
jgi:hypothetical protein